MKTDSIFFNLFVAFPNLFFQLIERSVPDPTAYKFQSVTVKETQLTMDGLLESTAADPDAPLFFTEVQIQKDDDIYYRLMAEIHLYFRQYKPNREWQAVILFPSEGLDPGLSREFKAWDGTLIKRIYLNPLRGQDNLSPEMGLIRLIVETPRRTETWARRLVEQIRRETDAQLRNRLLDLIETILAYKFKDRDPEEIRAMFGLADLQETRYYQAAFAKGKEEGKEEGKKQGREEGKAEGKLESVPNLLKLGLSLQQIAEALEVPLAEVEKQINGSNSN